MRTVRCSSLDRVIACAGSIVEAEYGYNPNSQEAAEGTAAHEALAQIVRGENPDIEALAARHKVPRDDLAASVAQGRRAWDHLRCWFGGTIHADDKRFTAMLSDQVQLSGTPDLLSVGSGLSILDFKTGWRPSVHPNQLRGYAYLAREHFGMPEAGYVLGIEVWTKIGEFRVHRFSDADLDALRDEILAQNRHAGEQWGPSPTACQYCPRQTNCAAREEYIHGGIKAIAPLAGSRYPVSRELVAQLWDRRTELYRALKRFDAIADEMLTEGPIPLDDGRQLEFVAEERERLIPAPTIRYLREHLELNADEANACLSVSKGKLGEVIKGRVPRGKGAAAIRQTMADLQQAGAVEKYIHLEKRVTAREE